MFQHFTATASPVVGYPTHPFLDPNSQRLTTSSSISGFDGVAGMQPTDFTLFGNNPVGESPPLFSPHVDLNGNPLASAAPFPQSIPPTSHPAQSRYSASPPSRNAPLAHSNEYYDTSNPSVAANLHATPFGSSPPLPQYALERLQARSSSVPIQTMPKPIRRRTQEWRDQETFVPTLYSAASATANSGLNGSVTGSSASSSAATGLSSSSSSSLASSRGPSLSSSSTGSAASSGHGALFQPNSSAGNSTGSLLSNFAGAPTLNNGVNGGGVGALWAPSTDHPLSMPEQQDLLDRVRRDLTGVDLDNIKGPLRALAMASQAPQYMTMAATAPGSGTGSYGAGFGSGYGEQQQSLPQPESQQAYQQSLAHTQALAQAAAGIRAARDAMIKAQAQQQRDRDEMMRKTVSPQEAFLDYDDVDHRLHSAAQAQGRSASLSSLPFGPSLFAPLPRSATPASSSPRAGKTGHGAIGSVDRGMQRAPRTPPPIGTVHQGSGGAAGNNASRASSPAMGGSRESPKLSSQSLPGNGAELSNGGSSRRPHPFAVPQNAVSWAEGRTISFNDGDNDVDDDAASSEETPGSGSANPSAAASVTTGPRKSLLGGKVHDDSPQEDDGQDSDVSRGRSSDYFSTNGPGSRGGKQPAPAPVAASASTGPVSAPVPAPPAPAPAPAFAAPAPPRKRRAATPSRRALDSESDLDHAASHGMRGSAKRAMYAMSHDTEDQDETENRDRVGQSSADEVESNGTGLSIVDDGEQAGSDDDFVPPASAVPARVSAVHSRRKKRSRTTTPSDDPDASGGQDADELLDTGGDSSDDADGSFFDDAGAGVDSDGGAGGTKRGRAGRKSGSGRGSNAAPNKRRRRQPTTASTTATSSTQIQCPHVNDDGSTCGVVFRRPYDLARHRETIHGEGLKPGKKVDWVCKACGGSFSRKDALIRHARIRGHNAGL